MSDLDGWHLVGSNGCIHEDDDDLHWRIQDGEACDCAPGNTDEYGWVDVTP